MDLTALFQLQYGLYVVATQQDGQRAACVANTVQQVTDQPVRITVGLNKNNHTNRLIHQSGRLTISALSKTVDMSLISNFGFQSSSQVDKFAMEGLSFALDEQQVPYLTQNTSVMLSARVLDVMDCGTHDLFLCEVTEARKVCDEEPMTYAYYHSHVKQQKPKTAPGQESWRCTICGYVHAGPLPEDFICPVCKQPASVFEKV